MILLGGVTKGAGLLEALGDRGLSQYSTIALGADNDHSLLDVCEIGWPSAAAPGRASRTWPG